MRPYPWKYERRRFTDQLKYGKALRKVVGFPASVLGFLLCPPTILVQAWSYVGFRRLNDSWRKRGLIAMAVGAVIAWGTFRVPEWLHAWRVALESFGERATAEPQGAVLHAMMLGLGPGLILAGLAALCGNYYTEFHAQRFLYRTRPTWSMRLRKRINTRRLRRGAGAAKGWVPFGLIVDDPIPWRTKRYGRVVQRPISNFGHGCICGTNGSGKTIGALNLAYHVADCNAAVFYLDFKASLKTQKALRAVADRLGVPFYSFDLGIGSDDHTWYDPLGWDGTPSEKASMLMDSFTFQNSGGAEFYRGVAEQWLPLQLEIMDAVGRQRGESKFDFLYVTSTPSGLRERIEHYRSGTDMQRGQYAVWKERIDGVKADHLAALRNNLAKVVNSAGARLRPAEAGAAPLSFAQVARDGGIVYFGMSVSDSTVLKTLGSLAIRDVTTLSAERQRSREPGAMRPVVMLVDEASRLAERGSVMTDLFATAREALIWLWPITQSLSSYPDDVQREIKTNAQTWVVYRLQDDVTAAEVTRTLGVIAVETETTEQSVTHHFLRSSETEGSGESRVTLGERQHLPADAVLKTPNRLAYVWFTGTHDRATREPLRNRRVKHDDIAFDAPLTLTVGADVVTDPPEPKERERQFNEMVPTPDTFADGGNSTPAQPDVPAPAPVPASTPQPQRTPAAAPRPEPAQADPFTHAPLVEPGPPQPPAPPAPPTDPSTARRADAAPPQTPPARAAAAQPSPGPAPTDPPPKPRRVSSRDMTYDPLFSPGPAPQPNPSAAEPVPGSPSSPAVPGEEWADGAASRATQEQAAQIEALRRRRAQAPDAEPGARGTDATSETPTRPAPDEGDDMEQWA